MLLYERTRDRCAYHFNDHVVALDDRGDAVEVEFKSGRRERYLYVIGADGPHSSTRGFALGPEDAFVRHLGYFFIGFTLPNIFGLDREQQVFSTVGRMAGLSSLRSNDRIAALLTVAADEMLLGGRTRTSTSSAGGSGRISGRTAGIFHACSRSSIARMTPIATRSARSACRHGRRDASP